MTLIACLIAIQDAALQKITTDAAALRPITKTKLAAQFLSGAPGLTPPEPRPLYWNAKTRKLATQPGDGFEAVTDATSLYFNTKYGSPLAYSRVLEAAGRFGMGSLRGKRVMDFGYGTVGHLRLMALGGAASVGVDVDDFLVSLYSHPLDQGRYGDGSVKLVNGFWPGDAKTAESVGTGFDLITSKNTLKRGYVHPKHPVDKRLLVDLGVSDAEFLRRVYASLNPGGLLVIYNLSPVEDPDPKKWVPWSDGRSAFTKTQFERAGFRVLEIDKPDPEMAKMSVLLGWDKSERDAAASMTSHITVCQRPPQR